MPKQLVGWREFVELPELCPVPIKAKADTGARTSALHAFRLRLSERDGVKWAAFEVHPAQRKSRPSYEAEAQVIGFRRVRSSSGHSERRPVIRTPMKIGAYEFDIDVTLTSRDTMGFRLLLGRSALRKRFAVDPGSSYVVSGKR